MSTTTMNVHYLELFYYVAHHGGITAAVQAMPYGIQQPALSSQLLQLERDLGITLFERRPFRLTPQGEELFSFVRPFFGRLEEVEARLQAAQPPVRIGAAEIVLREYLPDPLTRFRDQSPDTRISLRGGYTSEMLDLLINRDLDVVIAPAAREIPPGLQAHPLIKIPLALLVPVTMTKLTATQVLRQCATTEPLIALPESEPVTRLFLDELTRRRITWPVSLELAGLDLIRSYVERGFGIGLSLAVPSPQKDTGSRLLPLRRFPKLDVVAYTTRNPGKFVHLLLDILRQDAKNLATKLR